LRSIAKKIFRRIRLRLPQPWSRRFAQFVYLPKILAGHEPTRRTFTEEATIERLAASSEPLDGVGAGLSERVIEIPWVIRDLARQDRPQRILDIGTAFAPDAYKWLLVRLQHSIEVVDLAVTDLPGVMSHVADVRELPFPSGSFDVATCISTLEHIGLDNDHYGIRSGGDGDVQALRELGRVARRVLVTVPAGCDVNMGWQRQYSPATFRRTVEEAGLTVERLDVFVHEPGGWTSAEEASVEHRTYGQEAVAASASICAELRLR
jgi:SAM-dependent methyltransferase